MELTFTDNLRMHRARKNYLNLRQGLRPQGESLQEISRSGEDQVQCDAAWRGDCKRALVVCDGDSPGLFERYRGMRDCDSL